MIIVLVSKLMRRFRSFPRRVENKKCYGSLRLLNIFKNVLQIMMALQKVWDNRGIAVQLSLPFPGGKWVAMEKRENIEYLLHNDSDFFQSFTMCLRN